MSAEPRIFLERVAAKTLKVGDRFYEDARPAVAKQVLHDPVGWTYIDDNGEGVWEVKDDETVLKVVTPE